MPIAEEFGVGQVEYFPLPTDQEFLHRLLADLFENHWQEIVFGTLIQGAVFEIKSDGPPRKVSVFDGYLTVDFGTWHFHICIGAHKGNHKTPTPDDVAAYRQCQRAEFYRYLSRDGSPRSWGLRLYNGGGEQQLTVFLPNPFLSDAQRVLKTPEWDRLSLWDSFRLRYLGLESDPLDRSASRFRCGEH